MLQESLVGCSTPRLTPDILSPQSVTLPAGMVCVDPEKKWFQDYLNRQKKPNSTSE